MAISLTLLALRGVALEWLQGAGCHAQEAAPSAATSPARTSSTVDTGTRIGLRTGTGVAPDATTAEGSLSGALAFLSWTAGRGA